MCLYPRCRAKSNRSSTPIHKRCARAASRFRGEKSTRFSHRLAAKHAITLHAGSIVEKDGSNFYNTTLVCGPDGRQITRYRKIHLFDVDTPNGTSYRESDYVTRGNDLVTYRIGVAVVGCAICDDLCFPELFRALRDQGVNVIVLPAAFTEATGRDHWEVLLRARNIETQTYLLAVGQTGSHAQGRKLCLKHSLAIDPWGRIFAQSPDSVGSNSATLDLDYTKTVRAPFPSQITVSF